MYNQITLIFFLKGVNVLGNYYPLMIGIYNPFYWVSTFLYRCN